MPDPNITFGMSAAKRIKAGREEDARKINQKIEEALSRCPTLKRKDIAQSFFKNAQTELTGVIDNRDFVIKQDMLLPRPEIFVNGKKIDFKYNDQMSIIDCITAILS